MCWGNKLTWKFLHEKLNVMGALGGVVQPGVRSVFSRASVPRRNARPYNHTGTIGILHAAENEDGAFIGMSRVL